MFLVSIQCLCAIEAALESRNEQGSEEIDEKQMSGSNYAAVMRMLPQTAVFIPKMVFPKSRIKAASSLELPMLPLHQPNTCRAHPPCHNKIHRISKYPSLPSPPRFALHDASSGLVSGELKGGSMVVLSKTVHKKIKNKNTLIMRIRTIRIKCTHETNTHIYTYI